MKKTANMLFAITLLFIMLGSSVFASTITQDGLCVTLVTDEGEYAKEESITATLSVINNNAFEITNISLEMFVLDGYVISDSTYNITEVEQLASGESANIIVKYEYDGTDATDGTDGTDAKESVVVETDATNTGDDNNIGGLVLVIFLMSGIGILIVRNKKTRRFTALMLCVITASTSVSFTKTIVKAEETTSLTSESIEIKENIIIDGESTEIKGMVSCDTFLESDVDYHTVSIHLNLNDSDDVFDLRVVNGSTLYDSELPTSEGKVLVNLYENEDCTEKFDIYTMPVTSDLELYALWYDYTNDVDTDGDGISDSIEDIIGTEKNELDTDNDGLSDDMEINILKLDPLNVDTDGDGVNDGQEDTDEDGLMNSSEIGYGTEPSIVDSDEDGLSDGEEINQYNTDPLNIDTDSDGASDGMEVELGTNPLVANESFNIIKESIEEDSVKVSLDINLSGEQVESLSIDKVEDDIFFPEEMPGYLGAAYDFSVEGTFSNATLNFEFDADLIGTEGFDPVIYYFNEEAQQLEALETTVIGNVASADVSHFSKYILVNRTMLEEAFTWVDTWEVNSYSGVEVVLVIDDSGSMDSNDSSNQRLSVAQNLVNNLPENSKIGIVKFASSSSVLCDLTTDKTLATSYLTSSYFSGSGGTYMYTGISTGLGLYQSEDEDILKIMVVLSDGTTSDSSKYASVIAEANQASVKIYTVGLGSFDSSMESVASQTGAVFYESSNADGLAEIYDDINVKIDIETDSDRDGISDFYEENMVVFSGVELAMDKNNPDTDGDGLSDGEEVVELVYEYNDDKTQVKVTGKLLSDPTQADGDRDGLLDAEVQYADGEVIAPIDPDPLNYTDATNAWITYIEEQQNTTIPSEYLNVKIDDPTLSDWFFNFRECIDYSKENIVYEQVDKISDTIIALILQLRDPALSYEDELTTIIKPIYTCVNKLDGLEVIDLAQAGAIILNFELDEEEVAYHSQPDTWQRIFGYNDFYDDVFRIGTDGNIEYFSNSFTYDGENYVLWLWKGDYWNLQSGTEIGLYLKTDVIVDGTQHYDAIDFELDMSLSLYNHYSATDIDNIFHWSPTEEQWWITGFNPDYTSPDADVMLSVGTIDFSDNQGLYYALQDAISSDDNLQANFIFDDDYYKMWIMWK